MTLDKAYRKKLIASYLEAETTVTEEIQLAEYYSTHICDADEAAIARLILADHPQSEALSDRGAREFDSAVRRSPRRTAWHASAAAVSFAFAAIALFFIFRTGVRTQEEPAFSTVEIAQSIEVLYEMESDNIVSIIAEPKGAKVFLTAKMKDGSSNTFVMTRNPEDGSTKILAQNNVNKNIK